MRLSTNILAGLALCAASAVAQDFGSLPPCAVNTSNSAVYITRLLTIICGLGNVRHELPSPELRPQRRLHLRLFFLHYRHLLLCRQSL